MNQQFYSQFNPQNSKTVAVFGDRLRTSIINILAGETVKAGSHAFILSNMPMSYPLEGKVMVCDELSIVNRLIDKEKPKQLYLASKIKNDLLHPFAKNDLIQLIANLSENIILFINIDSGSKLNPKTSQYLKNAQMICSINYNLLKDNLPQISKIKELKSKSIDDQISDKICSIITKICPEFILMKNMQTKICFIDQVKGLYDENVMRSIARNLKSRLKCNMLMGNSNTYQVKAI